MKLADLEPSLLVRVGGGYNRNGESIADAHGLMFLCPKCFTANGGRVGTHPIIAWFAGRGVPDDAVPGPARWAVSGTGLDDITLSPSIALVGGCAWHGFVTAGQVTTC